MSGTSARWIAALALSAVACVPEGPPTQDKAPAKPASTVAPPSITTTRPTIVTTAAPSSSVAVSIAERPAITAPFEDDFNRAELGPDYNALAPTWKITGGKLCGVHAKNKGVWLLKKLPVNARIEFDAIAESAEGDLKVEVWGDGLSGATKNTYDDATSYIAILGGHKNTEHWLARLNEHGADRLHLKVDPDSDDERQRSIAAGQPYRFKIERADGKTIVWSVNNVVYFEMADPDPLVGPGHEFMAFNDWDSPVCFDNLRITPL